MSIRDLPRWLLPAALGVVVVIVLIVVLTGGGDDEPAQGPAEVVPSSAQVYLDLSVRPEDEAKASAEAALGTILDSDDPGPELISLIEKQAAEEGDDFDYEEDVAPWLGERFSVYLTKIGEDEESEGGFIFETTDADAALEFVNSQENEEGSGEEKEYEGTAYTIDEDGDAFGLVGDFLVGGDEPAFKAAVDANRGGSLAESEDFIDSIGDLDENRLGTLYVPIKQILESVSEEDLDPQARALLERSLGDVGEEPVLGQLTASETDVTFEVSAGGSDVQTEESSLLETLPADTWLALGFGDVGGGIDSIVDALDEAGIDADTIRTQVEAQTGIELDAVTAALGEAAVFVNGATMAELGGALIIQDKDQTVTANLLESVETLIRQQSQGQVKVKPLKGAAGFQLIDPTGQLKQPIQVVQGSGKIVAGYGASSVQQASGIATAPKTLSEEPAFIDASEAIGDLGVDAFLSIPTVVALAESEGAAQDSDYQQAKPYLEGLEFLALGSGSADERSVVRFVLGLR